jgi:type II secretory pathway pseudopilin PulG
MKSLTKKLSKGTTLIEVLIASAIFVIILTTIGELFQTSQQSFSKTEGEADADRTAAVILNQLSARVRAADYIVQGTSPINGPPLFPPPLYNLSANEPNSSGNFTAMPNLQGNYITLSLDPFGQNLTTIQFYRPGGPDGGTIYIYAGTVVNAPPPAAQEITGGKTEPLQDLEFWYNRGWATMRLSLQDQNGDLVQSSTCVFIRYYN